MAPDIARTLSGVVQRNAEQARSFTKAEREKLAKEGKAMSDLSFPIETRGDLSNAIKLARTGAQRAFIKKRAAALGASNAIPDEWSAADPADNRVTKAIEAAISAQEADEAEDRDPSDAKVMSLLKQALMAQRSDKS